MKSYRTDKYKTLRKQKNVGQCHWCGDDIIAVTKKKYCSGRCQYEFTKSRDIIVLC